MGTSTIRRFQHQSPQTEAGAQALLDMPLAERQALVAQVSEQMAARRVADVVDGWTDWDAFTPQDDGHSHDHVEDAAPVRREGRPSTSRYGNVVEHGPTDKQVAYLRSLVARLDGIGDADEWVDTLRDAGVEHGTWTKANVSSIIDTTKAAIAAQPSSTTPAPHVDGLDVLDRPNRYAGSCARCGSHIAEGGGLLAKRNGKWTVVHHADECVERPADTTPTVDLPDVPAGHYAIESTGHNDLAFYRVDRPTEGRFAGRTFVKLVVGGHPDTNVRRDHVAGILARIVEAGVVESAHRYGREIGRCCRCNRTLTDEASRAAGIGPDCASRGW